MGARAPEFRIIGGRWRGRRIRFASSARLRASASRVRESLFNCLGQRLDGMSCLDLFAGAGALGLEALSRGARRVVFVERAAAAVRALRTAASAMDPLASEVRRGDAAAYLARSAERFDVIFLDPPFSDYARDADWSRLLAAAAARLAPAGRAYCESDRHFPPPPGWRAGARRRAGDVRWQILDLDQ